jgi:hypothetical protein
MLSPKRQTPQRKNVPDSHDILNMTVSIGAMNGASSFKTLGVILSGPAALVGFNIFYPLQHGTWKGLSCEIQLIEFVDDITRNIDASKQTDSVSYLMTVLQ